MIRTLEEKRARIATGLVFCSLACASSLQQSTPAKKGKPGHLLYSDRTPDADATIILVAGSRRGAAFSREIALQRDIWGEAQAAGRVACFWTAPLFHDETKDHVGTEKVYLSLAHCHKATARNISIQLGSSHSTSPPFFFLYLTGHGTLHAGARDDGQMSRCFDSASPIEQRILLSPAIRLEADLAEEVDFGCAVLHELRRGVPVEELVVTPESLSRMLRRLPEESAKVVVLQACYSGAFVEIADHTNNVTVLTAAATGKESFGCGEPYNLTYFGGAFAASLRRHLTSVKGDASRIDWNVVYNDTSWIVETLEHIMDYEPSHPQILTTPGR